MGTKRFSSKNRQDGLSGLSHTQSPLLATRTPVWRSRLLLVLVGTGLAGLFGRALYVQVIGSDFFQQQGEARFVHKLELPASRGRIHDRSGQVLASSVAVPSFWAIPSEILALPVDQFNALAKALSLSPAELNKKLDPSSRFVWLQRQAGERMAADILALKLKNVYQDREYRRSYPEGEASAHVVGFTNSEERGQEGIELAFQKSLQGQDGSRSVMRDRLGRVVETRGETVPAINGEDVDLSLDAKTQYFAYQAIRDAVAANQAKAGSVVVLDARSGEILALANFPSYKPDERKKLSGEQLRNRALTDVFEPGSTMKPFIAAQALETGRVTPDTVIQTAPGRITITGSTISDAHPSDALTVAQVIQKSSNVGTVKMAMQMPASEMHQLYASIGMGQRPQIAFPGAVTGSLRPYKNWRPIEQATMSYGYGLSASLLQLARAYTVFAHDGELLPLSMTKRAEGEVVQGQRVFSAKTAQQVRQMLQTVTAKGGTAPMAQAEGYSVGGKSGTAYKQEGRGYARNKYRAWFVGLAPISQPRIVVAVMVDEPTQQFHDGGKVAGPVFSKVVSKSLQLMGVPADLAVSPQILAQQAASGKEVL
ncbi:peptidoglycan D,D-transpeptidase FtsI family protein [Paucibacter sp. Y2R2-4]|uniref:peptidoglycan D,D-transpeptidase FtsI family protein n=1 Tax=Paucibacter sp. Y2R2-4 TaxID=2893553 RepID=UPI0021E4336C|nr:penicillin-binding protein 2 [Paucibacter sp. Y2R2-4]MCV2349474.1 penicillin-binding protein 2 [Paucibacter sp. Y2R2-4]